MGRLARGLGWVLLVAGVIVGLYVVYLLWFTSLETDAAQQRLAEGFEQADPSRDRAEAPRDGDATDASAAQPAADEDAGDAALPDGRQAVLRLSFARGGTPIVADEPLYVVDGVTVDDLRRGPGRYPDSGQPGAGNLAVAGHRTTYGSPFWSLDELEPGDEIRVAEPDGRQWVYRVRTSRVVAPTDTWVVSDDPIGIDGPTITLTTCHPRFSAAQRLVVWGELDRDAD